MRTVRVEWEGPLSLDQVKELDDKDEDCGLYQIYGRHIIFGDGSLGNPRREKVKINIRRIPNEALVAIQGF